MTIFKTIAAVIVLATVAGLGFVYSGIYPIGADKRHSAITFWLLETLRKRSIASASKDIEVPPLSDPKLLLSGGADYNDMCAGCHLKPGVDQTDMTLGLYPAPPNLTLSPEQHAHEHDNDGHDDSKALYQQQYWVIKHGIMASGMASFGATHNDERIWAMVAFLQKLPELTPEQYQVITARK